MTSKDDIIVAFDFYGTLVSPNSVIDQLSEEFGRENAAEISSRWRRYQLEYTWRLNSMGEIPLIPQSLAGPIYVQSSSLTNSFLKK